ncbi:MAG: cytochrome c3 family protein [Verrucomicrobiota bacterium]|jgi:predicted CXXCH cytochrome family protein
MKFQRTLVTAGVLGIAGVAACFINSCDSLPGTVVAPLEIPGATFVGNQVCYDCHTNITRRFAASPHAHLALENTALPGGTGCESCHGPGSKHVAAGGGRGQFIINPGREPQACLRCHLPVRAEFELPAHHPVLEGHMNCAQCHDPHGADILKASGGLAMARPNEDCAQCHREQTRPFVFEHPALREGCTTCHKPHGSINRKMLTQPDDNLCFRCHSQVQGPGVPPGEIYIGDVPHSAMLRIGTCWSAGCHTAVHGSDVDPRLRY